MSLRKTTIGIQGKHFRESCVEPFVCDEAVNQLNTGKLPAAYKNSFTGILDYLEKTCSG